MFGLRKRALIGALMLAFGAVLVPTASAQAATNCSGSIIYHQAKNYGGKPIAELAVYWNASTGYNCARLNHLGSSYGVAAYTYVGIMKCTGNSKANPGICTRVDLSRGDYSYYAGPVLAYAPTNCVLVHGRMIWQGTEIEFWTDHIGC